MDNNHWRTVIIEDASHDRQELKALLLRGSTRSYQFAEAETGLAGIELCKATPAPDCAVIDFDLPDMNAVEILEMLPRDQSGSIIPVVILTGASNEQVSRAVLRAGAQEFVGKAWLTADSITRAIENAVERRRAATELALQADRQALLLGITRLILASQLDDADLVAAVFARIAAHLKSDLYFFHRTSADGALHLVWEAGLPESLRANLVRLDTDAPHALATDAIEHGQHKIDVVRNASDPLATFARSMGVRAFTRYLLPASDGTLIGTLAVGSTLRDEFSNGEICMVETICRSLSVAFERRAAEEAVRANAELNRSLMDASADCIKVLDLQGTLMHMSRAGIELLEIEDFTEVRGREWASLWPEETRARVRESVQRAAAGDIYAFQAFGPTPGGTPKWWDVRVSPVRESPDGPIVRLLAASRDITLARQSEEALRESEERFRVALDAAEMATWDWNVVADRIRWSDELIERQLIKPEQAPKSMADVLALVHPDDAAYARERIENSLAKGDSYEAEFRMIRADRSTRWVLAMARVFRDAEGKATRMMGVDLDITARRQADENLRQREAELRTITDNVPDVIIRCDRDFRYVFVNAAIADIRGLPAREYLGKTAREIGTSPALCDEWEASLRQVFGTGQSHTLNYTREIHNLERHFESRVIPEFGVDGKVAYALVVVHDVTAQHHSAAELAKAKAVAEAASAAKDRFLAVLSHELRTPLTPISMVISRWERSKDPFPARFERDLKMLRRNVDLECRLIDDMLDVNRVANGKLEIRIARVDLHAEVRHAIQTIESDAAAKQIAISFSPGAASAEVMGDAARLQQVLWNLLKNAVKFTPLNGRVSVRTYNRPSGHVCVEVKDTGAGIEPSVIERIFNAFEQGGADITRHFGGLGLGLAISKAIADLHDGRLTAFSAGEGTGATFTLELEAAGSLSLPVGDGNALAPTSSDAVPVPRQQGSRILLVEDDADTAELMKSLLRELGYDVHTGGSIAEALALVESHTFDLIISDLGLPDGSGYDLMRTVMARHPTKGIALSGYAMAEDVMRGSGAGFVAHLSKPIRVEQLQKIIQSVIGTPGVPENLHGL